MSGVPVEFALVLGSVAALNPCGFALLPTYLTLLVAGADPPGAAAALRRAGVMTAAMTAGFIAVFGAFGLVVVPAAVSVERLLPWVTVVIGAALVALGGWLVTGRELAVRVPRLRGAAPSSSVWSMAGYGVAYAVASLSCTVAPFLAMATATFTSSGIGGGLIAFAAYGVGMGLVVGVLAAAVALGGDALMRRARRLMPYVSRLSGALLVIAGGYVAYYGVYELRVYAGGDPADPVVDAALELQGRLSGLVADLEPHWLAVAGLVAVVVVLTATASERLTGAACRGLRRGGSPRSRHRRS
jgi:cytochrome c biogenesis protein CcdA